MRHIQNYRTKFDYFAIALDIELSQFHPSYHFLIETMDRLHCFIYVSINSQFAVCSYQLKWIFELLFEKAVYFVRNFLNMPDTLRIIDRYHIHFNHQKHINIHPNQQIIKSSFIIDINTHNWLISIRFIQYFQQFYIFFNIISHFSW